MSRADDRKSLENGLKEAALHDRRILVEEMIVGHEVECAVFGGGKEEVRASGVGEILAAADFYDFDAKYYNSDSRTVVDPELPGNAAEEIRESAVRIFKAVDGYGLSRVDFFVKEDGEVVFNEINTMPGHQYVPHALGGQRRGKREAGGRSSGTCAQALRKVGAYYG